MKIPSIARPWLAAAVLAYFAGSTFVNAQQPEKPAPAKIKIQAEPAVQFDSDALALTLEKLNENTNFEFEGMPLEKVLKMFSEKIGLKFRVNTANPVFVTIKSGELKFGKMLSDLLTSSNCQYSVLPNGDLAIRDKPVKEKAVIIPK